MIMKAKLILLAGVVFVLCSAGKPAKPGNSFDPLLLKRFVDATRSLDFNRSECTYRGIVDLVDPNDTTNTSRNIRFLFCRQGSGYYYKVGNTEMIHDGENNVFIRHDQHRVVFSHQQVSVKSPIGDLDKMAARLKEDGYTLKKVNHGRLQTISFINEQHVTCKEMSVTLDTVSGKLQRLYARLTDFGSPKDKGLDRVMDVRITELSTHANRKAYPGINSVVVTSGGRKTLTAKYANYELIML